MIQNINTKTYYGPRDTQVTMSKAFVDGLPKAGVISEHAPPTEIQLHAFAIETKQGPSGTGNRVTVDGHEMIVPEGKPVIIEPLSAAGDWYEVTFTILVSDLTVGPSRA